ncbi:hypothetical protein EHQ24_16045 [Leptospira noumeaensis]|uniref:PEGA domain-containing protein n=1 Tax=Leptospira noumeaensis TaxID=2484964 RepID=A0A4R9I150_9LEPT|nr:hypothetical protein [Leptospira noumeaensis]TGK79058.1 hypothetical protein EHQ24_16045 [Leptospira noumeaensis]
MTKILKNIAKLALFTTTLLTIGCATMFKPTTHVPIKVYADQLEASIYLDDQKVSESFHQIEYPVKSDKTFNYRIEKNGFEPKTIIIEKKFNTFAYLNLLTFLFSPVLFLIDHSNDALFVYKSPSENIKLEVNVNFKEKTDTTTYRKFESERDKLKNNKGLIQFNGYVTGVLVKDSDGKEYDLKSAPFLFSPGNFEVQSKFYTTFKKDGYQHTYTAKTAITSKLTLQPASATVVCTDFDNAKNITIHTLVSSGKPNPYLASESVLKGFEIFRYCPRSNFMKSFDI